MTEELERTHLYAWHKAHGDVVPFAGWEMPVRYSDIREEHMAVRTAAGLFDTTHMARFFVKGPQAADFLQTVTSNNVHKLSVNEGHYTTCLNQNGGIMDDLMLYRVDEDEYIWVTNAVNGPKIHDHLLKHAMRFDVKVINRTKDVVMVALQGPNALPLLSKLANRDLAEYGRFTCNPVRLAERECLLCRTGYTGEDGAEILLPNTPFTDEGKKSATSFWEEILKQGEEFGVMPCGLGARDSTRLEAGLVLYGHELDEDTSPIEARIPYAVKFKVEPHYIGYDTVLRHKKEDAIRKTRIALVMIDRGIPREHYSVMKDGVQIGEVTSGGLSPILNKGIALAYVRPSSVEVSDVVDIDIKGKMRKSKVTDWPFYNQDEYGLTRKV